MPIYTRTGDNGTTSLFGGKRLLKCEDLIDVYGSLDELNSWVGLLVSQTKINSVKTFLEKIQSDLFTMGSALAGWSGDLKILDIRVREMEEQIDIWEKQLPKLTNFVLPGGTIVGAQVHVARSLCRRVERQAVALAQKEKVDPLIVKYLNRLSDLFFVWARFINKKAKAAEIVWSRISPRTLKK